MSPAPENDLIERAKRGERAAFDRLAARHLPRLAGFVRRMVGHPEDSEDIVQEALARAWAALPGYRGEAAFGTWLLSIGRSAAVDFLRGERRWRSGAQVAYANLCAADAAYGAEVMGVASDPAFAFDVREHISYCFACVGRSLPPDEQAALVLRDVLELSAREAAQVLGVSDSVLRHRLGAARSAMTETYAGLCTLVSKTGICHQCAGLAMLAPEERRGAAAPDVSTIAERAAVARKAEPGAMAALHDLFWRRTKEVEAAGVVSDLPESDCGQ